MTETRKVLVIYTGGTIGMIMDEESQSLIPIDFEKIFQHIPVLESMHVDIDHTSLDEIIDSSDMNPQFWIKLVDIIEKNYLDYDGFVVLHGSDTMAYTASALSFMLENLDKPVILTGSQLPLGMVRSDGRENFINAVEIASAYEDDTPIVPEVCIFFENRLFRGNRTSKFNAEHFDAFISGNYPDLAEVGVHIKYNKNFIRKPSNKKLKPHKNLSNEVGILKLFPGIPLSLVENTLNMQNLKIVILESFGAGNAPTAKEFLNIIEKAGKNGKIILNISQCKSGEVEMGLYAASKHLLEMGVVSGKDMTTEAALTKSMYLLGEGMHDAELKKLLQKSIRGEMSN